MIYKIIVLTFLMYITTDVFVMRCQEMQRSENWIISGVCFIVFMWLIGVISLLND